MMLTRFGWICQWNTKTKEYTFKGNMVLKNFDALPGILLVIWAHNFIIARIERN